MIQAIPAVHVLGRKLGRDLNGIFIEDVFKDIRQSSINLWGIHPKIPPAILEILTCCLAGFPGSSLRGVGVSLTMKTVAASICPTSCNNRIQERREEEVESSDLQRARDGLP